MICFYNSHFGDNIFMLMKVIVICGGSYRRGKATCGDLDIVITHPDGERLRNLYKFL